MSTKHAECSGNVRPRAIGSVLDSQRDLPCWLKKLSVGVMEEARREILLGKGYFEVGFRRPLCWKSDESFRLLVWLLSGP